ncbi:MAG: hypothetical protein KIT33_00215 [Candidatus Kapabacteria bacterium]|nr:hypothetical protein [Ignavibacteriota bacterium]MCW5883372.1 hypothetical protein [Candidatus Kapabacteria bacterium]
MNLVYYEIVEDCIEAKNVYDAYLSIKLDDTLISHLAILGKLVFFKDFEKPYFRVISRGKFTIKGIENDDKFRILLPDDAGIESLELIKSHINSF